MINLETSTDQDPTAHDLHDQGSTDQDLTTPGMEEYLENGYNYSAPKRGDIRPGVIIGSNDYGLVVDIGFKREGFVPAEDLTRLDEETRSEVQVGITVPVFVLRPENKEGHPILSIHQARLYQDWIEAERMMENGELYEGEVSGYNRGGLIVKFGKIRGFIPASQIVGLPKRLREEQRRQRLSDMIGQRMGLKIIEVDRQRRRLIFSQRRALRAWQELQRDRVMAELAEGEIRHGRVTSITNFGAFVDLGGADGLIHVSELSWKRIDNPRQMLRVGDEVDVCVLDVDRQRKRIALSIKKLQPDPWTIIDDHYRAGQLIEGLVTRVLDFGAFIELDLGVEGLLHASEMIGTPELAPSDIVHPGETLLVKIIRIDSQRKRLALSAKQVRKGEWERWVAEQQAAHEVQEAAARDAVESETAAPEAEVTAGAAAEEEAPAPGAEVATGGTVEEEPALLEAEAETTISATAGEEAPTPEAEATIGAIAEEGTPAPEAEAMISEVAEEEAAVLETEAAITKAGEEPTKTETDVTEANAEPVTADETTP